MSLPFTDTYTVLNAVASTTTSDMYDISKRQQISIQFITTGVTVFTVDVSNDGTNWVTGISFQDALATATTTYVVSKSVNNSTAGAFVKAGFKYIRVVGTVSSGTATAVIQTGG